MYIHLGGDVVVKIDDIVGIFDIEKTSAVHDTREFLRNKRKNLTVINVSYDMPRSFIAANLNGRPVVYISPISPATLRKRSEMLIS